METLYIIEYPDDIKEYRSSGEIENLDLTRWKGGDVDLREIVALSITFSDAKIAGHIDLSHAQIGGSVNLSHAQIGGSVNLSYAKIKGDVIRSRAKIMGEIIPISPITEETKRFLQSLPMERLEMEMWQSDEEWKRCETMQELHECGTMFCIRGWAEAVYKIKNGVFCPNPEELYPELIHLFYLSNEQAEKEIHKILAS